MYNNFNPDNGYNNYYAQQYYAEQQRIAYYKMKRNNEKNSLIKTGILLGSAILADLFIQTVIVLALQKSSYFSVYQTSSVFQNCFNVVAVHMSALFIPFALVAFIKKKSLTGPLVPMKKIGFIKAAALTSLGMGLCIAANYLVNCFILVFKHFGYELKTPEMLKADSALACITLVVSTVIVPAIFEEFAFRCCTLGVLRQYGKGFAVVTSSIVFGLIHGNIIQFIFTFFVGLVLAYITVKTDNIIPAMLIHGCNNGLSVVQEILTYTSGKNFADDAVTVLFVIWTVLAVASLIYLVLSKEITGIQPKTQKEPYVLSIPAKFLCLVPGMFIPATILIILSKSFITKTG